MVRFLIYLAIALLVAVPGVLFRITGAHPGALVEAGVFGMALLAAGFLLSWGAEAAESRVSQGLLLAGLALVTVLPEFAVDIYYAFRAGQVPGSSYVHYAAANMTGANRLLIGTAWPLVVILHWWKSGERAVVLARSNFIELFFLALASLYAFVILLKDQIDIVDFIVLLAIFAAYLWRLALNRKPHAVDDGEDNDDDHDEDDKEPGPAAVLETLSPRAQWAWTAGLTIVAGTVILIGAEPFAESMIASGRILGIDEFLLIQWIAPLTGEAPEIVLGVLFVLAARASSGLIALISDKINQWTLLVGALPMAMSIGAGSLAALPLSARQHEEFFLTAAQSLFAISLLLGLRLTVGAAALLFVLFALQGGLAFALQHDPPREIAALTSLAWVYIALALAKLAMHGAAMVRSRTPRAA